MKPDVMFREFLSGYLHMEVRIVTKVGTVHEGFYQGCSDDNLHIAKCSEQDKSSTLICLKDIAVIEETDIGGKDVPKELQS